MSLARSALACSALVLGLAVCALAACAQPDRPAPADSLAGGDDRATRIAKNLALEVPALREASVEVTDLAPSEVSGLDRGTFTTGGQSYPFLVTEDDTRLFILAADPVDVSRTADEVAAALAEEAEETAQAAAEHAAALATATQGFPTRGPSDAPVTVVEFSDFQCPYCRRAAGTVEQLLDRYPEEVQLIYAHFPLGNHAWARPAAIAATCAAKQDEAAFWALHDFYFQEQQALTVDNVVERSREALAGTAADREQWATCAADTASAAHAEAAQSVEASVALGEQHGVRGTPAFFVNGQFLSGAQPLEAFVEAVEAARSGAR